MFCEGKEKNMSEFDFLEEKVRREKIKESRKKDAIYTAYKCETVDQRVRRG